MVFAGEGFGCAALVPLSAAARSRGLSTVILAAFARADAVFKQAEIEAVADRVLWLAGSGPAPAPRRPQDAAMTGDLAAALGALERDANVAPLASLPPVARVVVLGPDEAIVSLRSFGGDGTAEGVGTAQRWGAIVAPMQCMMKEVCARCLQPVRNPATGKSELVFACAHPHQPLADVDLAALAARLGQNRLQENLTSQWLARLLP